MQIGRRRAILALSERLFNNSNFAMSRVKNGALEKRKKKEKEKSHPSTLQLQKSEMKMRDATLVKYLLLKFALEWSKSSKYPAKYFKLFFFFPPFLPTNSEQFTESGGKVSPSLLTGRAGPA